LGELELEAGVDSDSTIRARLVDMLNPLNLPAGIQDKILQSAQTASARHWQEAAGPGFDHIHLLILVPRDHTSRSGTWGFFRIEKIDTETDKINPDHTVEFYLYLEGQ
jgi:hypothetical protein